MTMGESSSSGSNSSEQAGYLEVKSKGSRKKGAAKSMGTPAKLPSPPSTLRSAGADDAFTSPYGEKRMDGNPKAMINDDKVTKTRGSNKTGMFTQPFGTNSTLSSVSQDQVTFQASTPKSGTTPSYHTLPPITCSLQKQESSLQIHPLNSFST